MEKNASAGSGGGKLLNAIGARMRCYCLNYVRRRDSQQFGK